MHRACRHAPAARGVALQERVRQSPHCGAGEHIVIKSSRKANGRGTGIETSKRLQSIRRLLRAAIAATPAVAAATLAFSPQRARGATLFWSGNGTTEGGAGQWTTNTAHFGTVAAGPYNTTWNNANVDS